LALYIASMHTFLDILLDRTGVGSIQYTETIVLSPFCNDFHSRSSVFSRRKAWV